MRSRTTTMIGQHVRERNRAEGMNAPDWADAHGLKSAKKKAQIQDGEFNVLHDGMKGYVFRSALRVCTSTTSYSVTRVLSFFLSFLSPFLVSRNVFLFFEGNSSSTLRLGIG